MKKFISVLLMCALTANAKEEKKAPAFIMPKEAYRINQLQTAQAEALKKNKAIAFINTDLYTSASGSAGASERIFSMLKKKVILIYVDDTGGAPGIVNQAYSRSNMGMFIPKTAIIDPNLTNIIATIPYGDEMQQLKAVKDALNDVSRAMRQGREAAKMEAALTNQPQPEMETKTNLTLPGSEPKAEPREIRTWTSSSGATLQASFVTDDGFAATLQAEDGENKIIPLSKLSKEDRDYISQLKKSLRSQDAKNTESPEKKE